MASAEEKRHTSDIAMQPHQSIQEVVKEHIVNGSEDE